MSQLQPLFYSSEFMDLCRIRIEGIDVYLSWPIEINDAKSATYRCNIYLDRTALKARENQINNSKGSLRASNYSAIICC